MARAVGIDLGTRRIGVAVSDAAGTLAFPRDAIVRRADAAAAAGASTGHETDPVLASIVALVEEVDAEVVVVGLPLSLNGRVGPAALGARAEALALARALEGRGVRVEMADERFTTVTAAAAMADAGKSARARRAGIDSAAATVLLQSWLDAR